VPSTAAPPETRRLSSLFGNLELVIVVLLGIVSVVTAYASFQAALYGSKMDAFYADSTRVTAEAESAYLEGNQQYVQDSATVARLIELEIEAQSDDSALAALAAEKLEAFTFVAVSDELAAAIAWSEAENAADPDTYTPPQNDDAYLESLFGTWSTLNDEAAEATANGDAANSYGDRLTLNTVLFAVSLFLLGVAAVLQGRRAQYTLIGVSTVIFAVGLVLTASIPVVTL
jgi:Tfp pilus assembly protein PilE